MKSLINLDGKIENCIIEFYYPSYMATPDGALDFSKLPDGVDCIVDIESHYIKFCRFSMSKPSGTNEARTVIMHNKWNSNSSGAISNQKIERVYSGNIWFWIGFGVMCLVRKLNRYLPIKIKDRI